jgi:hypothetical protein
LGIEEPRVVADIPPTYHIPDTPSFGTIHNGKQNIFVLNSLFCEIKYRDISTFLSTAL